MATTIEAMHRNGLVSLKIRDKTDSTIITNQITPTNINVTANKVESINAKDKIRKECDEKSKVIPYVNGTKTVHIILKRFISQHIIKTIRFT